jgi:predicted FMN-binding regulatory protein PaiB
VYLPRHFEQTDPAQLHALMRTLFGHVARANLLWHHAQGQRVLAVFQEP